MYKQLVLGFRFALGSRIRKVGNTLVDKAEDGSRGIILVRRILHDGMGVKYRRAWDQSKHLPSYGITQNEICAFDDKGFGIGARIFNVENSAE